MKVLTLGRWSGGRKTGAREFPLSVEVLEEILRWPRVRDTIHGVSPRTVPSCYRQMRAAFRAAKVEPWPWGGYRRSATDRIYEAGAGPAVEASLLGHSELTALKSYRKPRRQQLATGALSLAPPAQLAGTDSAKTQDS